MSTSTQNTGDYDHPHKGWGADAKRQKQIDQMLKNKSKEEIIKWLLKNDPSEAERGLGKSQRTGGV